MPLAPATTALAQTAPAAAPAASPAAAAPDPARLPYPVPQPALRARLEDWPQLGRYAAENAALPARAPGRVVFFGDSITEAWGRGEGADPWFPGRPYLNRGISGQTTAQMLVRFRQDAIRLHPEAVLLLGGTNDIAGNTGPTTPARIEDNFRSIADLARANHIRLVLCSILPAERFPWAPGIRPAAAIRELNGWLRQFARENGLVYVDYYSAMADREGAMKPGLSGDGVHPTAAGYARMAPLAEAGIERALGRHR